MRAKTALSGARTDFLGDRLAFKPAITVGALPVVRADVSEALLDIVKSHKRARLTFVAGQIQIRPVHRHRRRKDQRHRLRWRVVTVHDRSQRLSGRRRGRRRMVLLALAANQAE